MTVSDLVIVFDFTIVAHSAWRPYLHSGISTNFSEFDQRPWPPFDLCSLLINFASIYEEEEATTFRVSKKHAWSYLGFLFLSDWFA